MLLIAAAAATTIADVNGASRQTFTLAPAMVFSSSRDNPYGVGSAPTIQERSYNAADVYLWRTADGLAGPLRRLTNNAFADGLAAIDPTGRKIVFDSNRARAEGELLQISDLFVANIDEYDESVNAIPDARHFPLTRGSSGAWSPDGRWLAFHGSASGNYTESNIARLDPGAPTRDSDIFVLNVDDCLASPDACRAKSLPDQPGTLPEFIRKVTHDECSAGMVQQNVCPIDEDPDWSPDGTTIVFTRHAGEFQGSNNFHAEVFAFDVRTGALTPLTSNSTEERAPAWSPDGRKILYMCRRPTQFQVCVIEPNAEGVWIETQLTTAGQHLSARWSADGQYIVFHRPAPNSDPLAPHPRFQLFRLTVAPDAFGVREVRQLTMPPGWTGFPSWGNASVRPTGR